MRGEGEEEGGPHILYPWPVDRMLGIDLMLGTACLGPHAWDRMLGTACLGSHAWDRMLGTACLGPTANARSTRLPQCSDANPAPAPVPTLPLSLHLSLPLTPNPQLTLGRRGCLGAQRRVDTMKIDGAEHCYQHPSPGGVLMHEQA